jgi:hypothetical protein
MQTTPSPQWLHLALAGGGPHALEVTVTLGQAVEGVVALTAGADETAHGVGLVLASVAAVLVNLADGDLDGGVVVGLDDPVGGAALAGHVEIDDLSLVVLHFGGCGVGVLTGDGEVEERCPHPGWWTS